MSEEDCGAWNTIKKEMTSFSVSLPRKVTKQQGCRHRTLSVFVEAPSESMFVQHMSQPKARMPDVTHVYIVLSPRFCRVPFGINAGPAILNQALLKHLESFNSDTYQEIAEMLYVDNVILDGKNPEDLLRKYRESKKVFNAVGMNLRDYLSNCSSVNDGIPLPDRASATVTKVLGLQWNSNDDHIALQCANRMHMKTTKRTVLSQINGLCFDPLGLITPLLTKAKIFLQDLHKKLGWDDALSEEDCGAWNTIKKEMTSFSVSLPRKITQQQLCKHRILSVFVDSSKRVYACAAYVTTESEDARRYTRLYCAKSKVAPIGTTQTIPKLELLAVFIGVNMIEYIISRTGLKIDRINLFSDSTIALSWVHSKKRLPSHQVDFYHVSTCETMADHATRSLTHEDALNSVWFGWPEWLNHDHSTCPVDHLSQEEKEECFVIFAATQETHHINSKKRRIWPTEKVSNYNKLRRIVT
ncbi:Pao retrotransposon peptidase [Oesophagostomum dentatum]|uniref:Pao retrotransposon peptidase n=1 Tax=Oesophagostomum dentatum TaxID=61180 RepID=A0A0B1SPM7_OESDE|nr:Pao retrotransposon peptidase [Oesophagostomum dentatum]